MLCVALEGPGRRVRRVQQLAQGPQAVELVCERDAEQPPIGSEMDMAGVVQRRCPEPFVVRFGVVDGEAHTLLDRQQDFGASVHEGHTLWNVAGDET